MSAGRSPCAAASTRFTSSQESPAGRASYGNTRGAMIAAAKPGRHQPRPSAYRKNARRVEA